MWHEHPAVSGGTLVEQPETSDGGRVPDAFKAFAHLVGTNGTDEGGDGDVQVVSVVEQGGAGGVSGDRATREGGGADDEAGTNKEVIEVD